MRKYILCLVGILILMVTCAHKAPPLFKDRMRPRLAGIQPLNNRQVQFSFSETLDTMNLTTNSFSIYAGSDTLTIITLYPSLSAAEIVCLTEPQLPVEYQVTGTVYDTAQNKSFITSSFTGSAMPDTVAPYVVEYSQGRNNRAFLLRFSEAMDTSRLDFYLIPEFAMVAVWQDLRTCRIAPNGSADSLAYGFSYFMYIHEGVFDVSGNPLPPFITSITSDTAYEPRLLSGEVRANDTLVRDGIVVFNNPDPFAMTFIQSGLFTVEVRDHEPCSAEALSNGFYGTSMVWPDSSNVINVSPTEKTIDSIIR